MNYRNGKLFFYGHLIIPGMLLSLYFIHQQQLTLLALVVISFLWAIALIVMSTFTKIVQTFLASPMYWFFILIDSAILAAVNILPVWTGTSKPTWLILFLIPFYAYQMGRGPATFFSLFGILQLYLYAQFQKTPFSNNDTSLILIGMLVSVFFVGSGTDRLKRISYQDALTSLPNRFHFTEDLVQQLEKAKKRLGQVGIMLLDLDQFKYVNDTMGHATGDELLQSVAQRLRKAMPRGAILARMGGDEFAILLPGIPNSDAAAQTADLIIKTLTPPFPINNQEIYVTTSIGISQYPDDGTDTDTLLKRADTAMYRAKEHGRNNYQFYTSSLHTEGIKRLEMETMLRHALERDEFIIYYQPRVDTHTDELLGVEALVRWIHPSMGMIPPGEFIPLAEDTGLINGIGELVLRKACQQRQWWTNKGIQKFRMSVNLSPRQFRQLDLPEMIQKVLGETGMSPELLELEVTESAAMQDVNFAILMLRVLKEMGLTIAIDDFGTGYSSLSYLKKFPIDLIKIDQSFIMGIQDNSDDAAIVTAIIVLAHTLKLKVCAEGVETSLQYAYLKNKQCEEIQGYLIGKPMKARDLEAWLQLRNESEETSSLSKELVKRIM